MKQLLVILLFVLPLSAMAAQSPAYFSLHGGAVFPTDSDISGTAFPNNPSVSFDTGYMLGASLGTRINPNMRIEAEVDYRKADIDQFSALGLSADASGSFEVWDVMGNILYDFSPGSAWQPYIGAGVGYASGEGDLDGDSDSDGVLAYQAIAGIGYRLSDALILSVDYRYFALSDPEFDNRKTELATHNVVVSLRF